MIKEEHRRMGALVLVNVGWWGALLVMVLRVTGHAPQSLGVVAAVLIGVAISAGLSLSRMRLMKTIQEVFKAGYDSDGGGKHRDND